MQDEILISLLRSCPAAPRDKMVVLAGVVTAILDQLQENAKATTIDLLLQEAISDPTTRSSLVSILKAKASAYHGRLGPTSR